MPHEHIRTDLDDIRIDDLLSRMRFGHLATVDDAGNPYVIPLDYRYVEGIIYFHGAREGQKIKNLRVNPRVCFEVTSIEPITSMFRSSGSTVGRTWKCVVVRGTAEEVTDEVERSKVFSGGRAGVYKIIPTKITGRATFRKK